MNGIPDPACHPAAALALTLELLTARISRDLDADANEGTLPGDPAWADIISRLADYSRECAEILNAPQVAAAITGWESGVPEPVRSTRGEKEAAQ